MKKLELLAEILDLLILTYLLIKGVFGFLTGNQYALSFLAVAALWSISIGIVRIYELLEEKL